MCVGTHCTYTSAYSVYLHSLNASPCGAHLSSRTHRRQGQTRFRRLVLSGDVTTRFLCCLVFRYIVCIVRACVKTRDLIILYTAGGGRPRRKKKKNKEPKEFYPKRVRIPCATRPPRHYVSTMSTPLPSPRASRTRIFTNADRGKRAEREK